MPAVSYLQAVHDALQEEMRRDDRVFIMGEDVGFNMLGATGGFLDEFGAERVRNTPITEAGFTGAAAGAAMVGMRPVVDLMLELVHVRRHGPDHQHHLQVHLSLRRPGQPAADDPGVDVLRRL